MLTLHWPWLLMLLPLPWFYRLVRPPVTAGRPALRSRLYAALALAGGESRRDGGAGYWLRYGLLVTVWLGLILAVARPTWVGEPMPLPTSGRDLLLAVDISESMQVRDMATDNGYTDRLSAVKAIVGGFVEQRRGDRLGLILFGSRAYLQTPLTFDRRTLNTLLQEARIGFAGGATAIGDAIGIAVKRLQSRPDNSRVLILLSDGADTASVVPPLKAAELAAAHDIKIYTVGIGAEEIVRRGFFSSQRLNPSADLDEEMLKEIAATTGGRYFRARDPEQLARIYETIDRLEPVEQEAETLRPTKALFHWPLTLAFAGIAVLGLLHRQEDRHG
jgi:Ca-activated chloride channel family protein